MKVVNTKVLLEICRHARQRHFSRLLDRKIEDLLDPNGLHLLSQEMINGDVECIRCTVVMLKVKDRKKPIEWMLDITFEDWEKIPTYEPQDFESEGVSNE